MHEKRRNKIELEHEASGRQKRRIRYMRISSSHRWNEGWMKRNVKTLSGIRIIVMKG